MKLRKLSLMLILALCLSIVPVAAFASSSVVSLNTITPTQAGGSVTLSGTSTLNEVIIKVLRPGNSTLFYDIVKVNSGSFSSSFTLGANELAGTYKVIAGQADQVDTKDLVVTATTVPPTPEPTCTTSCPTAPPTPAPTCTTSCPPTSPTCTTSCGPITGTITVPATPTPTPTATPAGKPITPPKTGSVPVAVDTTKNIVTATTAPNGQVTKTVKQDDTALAAALASAAKQDNKGDAPLVTITFNNAAGEAVVFNLSSSVLAAAALNAPNTIVSLQTNDGEYSLPLSVIDFAALAQNLSTTGDNIAIQITIAPVTPDINTKIKADAQGITTSQLGSAIEFSLTATGNGKTIELNNFGTTYVERNIVLTIPVDETHATVVLYNPLTGEFSFVPALFEKQADGSTKVTFKRNGNSIYTVLSSNKSFADISKHWAKTDIELLASKLVVNGVTDTKFAPESNITRAEFAALLVRSLGLTADAASATFKDVKSTDWFAGTVGAAVKAKLVDGFSDNSFKPNATITREQMAVMVSRAIKAAGKNVGSASSNEALAKFTDKASISSWAQVAVAQSVDAKIITGMTDKTFVPTANANRAQAVVMLKRLLQYTTFIN